MLTVLKRVKTCSRNVSFYSAAASLFFVLISIFLTTCGVAFGNANSAIISQESRKKPKNVLVLFTDDQRFDTIHALGNEQIETPHLDRLVSEGFVFTHAFIMGSMQGAVCVPSRAMFLSGRSLWHVPENLANVPTWPEVFKNHGFETFITGKWHNGRESLTRSFTSGNAIFLGGMSDHNATPVFAFDPTGKYPESARKIGNKFSSELFADACIEFLRGYRGEKPFLAYVAFTAPHDPRTPPEEFRKRYDPADISLPPNFLPEHPFDNGELRVRDELLTSFPRHPDEIRRHIAEYYGMITHLDAQIGRIIAALAETGHLEDTLVVFAGDNGLAVGQHGLMGKQNLYEHSQRVPLIFTGPGIPAGRSDALVYLFDVYPTVFELLGVPLPDGVEGRSLVPIIQGKTTAVRESVFGAYRGFQRSVRTESYKYIRYRVGQEINEQLFDLRADPWETRNLANERAMQDVKHQLQQELEQWRRELGDQTMEF
ncbi:MAG: sulfatase-like hydrolase/transferase [Thermogutta sp.]